MRIAIDLSPTVHGRAGLGRLAGEMTAALLALETEHRFVAFYNAAGRASVTPPFDKMAQASIPTADKPWRFQVLLAQWLRRSQRGLFADGGGPVDLFHATDHLLPFLPGTRTLFTLGDLTFLSHGHTHATLNRTFLRLMMPLFLRRADGIVTISRSTQQEMERYYGPLPTPSHVIYPGVDNRFQPVTDARAREAVRVRYRLPARFVLYVGTIEPRKNLPVLIRAFGQAGLQGVDLVLAGKKGWLYAETFAQVEALGLADRVHFTGFVDDADLPALLSAAELFVYPSLSEGFGLPVLEAMACGAPVITSNVSSLPEVAGDAGLLVDPLDVEALAAAMQTVLADPARREAMAAAGRRQAAGFSWQRCAQETLALYEEIGR